MANKIEFKQIIHHQLTKKNAEIIQITVAYDDPIEPFDFDTGNKNLERVSEEVMSVLGFAQH